MTALFLVVISLMLVLASVLVRVLERQDRIDRRLRQVWMQLQNVCSMLLNAGYKVKKPKDWRDDFSETRIMDPKKSQDWDRDE